MSSPLGIEGGRCRNEKAVSDAAKGGTGPKTRHSKTPSSLTDSTFPLSFAIKPQALHMGNEPCEVNEAPGLLSPHPLAT